MSGCVRVLRLVSCRRAPAALLALVSVAACGQPAHGPAEAPDIVGADPVVTLGDPRPMPDGAFPCTDCHDPELPVRLTQRELTKAHQEIALHHGGQQMWCWDCHDVKDRDQLKTAGGVLIGYERSHELCRQCHSREYADWEAGAHGRRTGNWNGERIAARCSECHAAHAPAFGQREPKPAPARPRRTR